MKRFLFIGESRSAKAVSMDVYWQDGRLAAKQLFDALMANNLDPSEHEYTNLFEHASTEVRRFTIQTILFWQDAGHTIVAMGRKVSHALTKANVDHICMVHPAARGSIRRKDRYAAHVKQALGL